MVGLPEMIDRVVALKAAGRALSEIELELLRDFPEAKGFGIRSAIAAAAAVMFGRTDSATIAAMIDREDELLATGVKWRERPAVLMAEFPGVYSELRVAVLVGSALKRRLLA